MGVELRNHWQGCPASSLLLKKTKSAVRGGLGLFRHLLLNFASGGLNGLVSPSLGPARNSRHSERCRRLPIILRCPQRLRKVTLPSSPAAEKCNGFSWPNFRVLKNSFPRAALRTKTEKISFAFYHVAQRLIVCLTTAPGGSPSPWRAQGQARGGQR